jgi:hypothetical protein
LRLLRPEISLPLMMRTLRILAVVFFAALAVAAPKPHVIGFGSPQMVKLDVGPAENRVIDLTVRALYADTKLKEFTTGKPHDLTDRIFVVRPVFRINDALPDDSRKASKWMWQLGGWLLVDRSSGKITQLKDYATKAARLRLLLFGCKLVS